jgi:Putative beta-barrel porin-2, OmpL-like. bbp2
MPLLGLTLVTKATAQSADSATAQDHDSAKATDSKTSRTITFGAFVDAYYAWDTDRPYNFDRAFTTQPARHAEFNINLAFVEAKIAGPRYRGRLALQFGTSVQANYAAEPRIGKISGPSVSQFVQEATLGYQLKPTLWLDGGIFLAHTGYEGWISRDNLTYTRSLIGDFSPYYESGVKLTWSPSSRVTTQLLLVNGWQNISKYNTPPAAGMRVDWTILPQVVLSYDNFVGNVAPDSAPAQLRVFHDFIATYNPARRWHFAASFDVGTQSRSSGDGGTAMWYGGTVIGKYQLTPRVSVVARAERYSDPHQVVARTSLPSPFVTWGGSLGVDVALAKQVQWRSEMRGFFSKHPVWPTHDPDTYARDDGFFVTSLSLTI